MLKALFSIAFFAVLQLVVAQNCAQYSSCTACIADQNCGYCSVIMFGTPEPASCMPIGRGPIDCPRYPQRFFTGRSSILSQTAGYPVNPSQVSVYLLPGDTLNLDITVSVPATFNDGLDVFLIQDLSGSFQNDMPDFSNVLPLMVRDVLAINQQAHFGIASFIETPLEPFGWQNGFTDTDGLEGLVGAVYNFPPSELTGSFSASTPCLLNSGQYNDVGGRSANGGSVNHKFCMEQPLTRTYASMLGRFASLITHNNLDFPEPSLDAIYYSSQCMSEWRPNARKLAVLITDARPHLGEVEVCTLNAQNISIPGCVGDLTRNYVTIGYVERENDLDCTLNVPSSTWTSNYWPTRSPSAWSYANPATQTNGGGGPGSGENYINADQVEIALRGTNSPGRGVIIPLIACANDPNNQVLPDTDKINSPYWDAIVANWGFGFSRILTLGAGTNLVQLILDALRSIEKTVQMVVQSDPLTYVNAISPQNAAGQHVFANTSPGDVVRFTVSLLVPSGQATQITSIELEVLGFGRTTIDVTNLVTCPGCNGNPNWREDLCGVCNPAVANQCTDCLGTPGGNAIIDVCGICNGDGSTCTGCNPLDPYNQQYSIDICGICRLPTDPLYNVSCLGCDGQVGSLQNDSCGVCGGNDACVGCDGIAFSGASIDNCGVCAGNGSTCLPVEPAVSTPVAVSIAVGIAIFIALAIIAIIAIVARLAKNKIDERKFVNAFAAGNAIATSPIYQEKEGWKNNAIAHS